MMRKRKTVVILAIKPKYAEAIYAGKKRWEFRKEPNTCAKWLFNEISADNPNRIFKPRKKSGLIQIEFDFMERSLAHGEN